MHLSPTSKLGYLSFKAKLSQRFPMILGPVSQTNLKSDRNR